MTARLTLRTFQVFDTTAAKVWALLEDFGALERWWPTEGPMVIERVELEGHSVGMVRHIYNRGAGTRVSERLDRLEPHERLLQLSILSPDPTRPPWYQATARVVELQDGRCRLEYDSEFTAPRGRENQVRDGILAAYREMFKGLRDATV
jgi:uncharacterized protein YndB with AHSA1/START domain